MRRSSVLAALSLLVFAAPAVAQPEFVSEPVTPIVIDVDLRHLPTVDPWQPGDPIVVIPEGYPVPEEPATEEGLARLAASFADPVVGSGPGLRGVVPAGVSQAGMGFNGFQPPDVIGDVGPNHYVQMINASVVLILDKDGNVAAGPFNLETLWSGGGNCPGGFGDPIVVYDELADRWFLSEFASGNTVCFYVSQTGDPVSGGWFLYDFGLPAFPDYPKYSTWPDAYYMTSYEGSVLGVFAFDRDAMLAGTPATFQRFTMPSLSPVGGMNLRDTRILPPDLAGPNLPPDAPTPLFRPVEAFQDFSNQTDRLEIWEFDLDWVTPANSTFTMVQTITPAEFSLAVCSPGVRDCVDQPSALKLDALSGRPMQQLQYRNFGTHETLVTCESVNAGGRVGVRWWELRRTMAPEGLTDWVIHQEGTYSPDTDHRWMGSIAMNGDGDMALGYTVSSTTTSPSIRVATRRASDPLNTFPNGELSLVEGDGTNSSSRWGDYSAMSVDPTDDLTFWYTGEWANASNNRWDTWIASFNVAELIYADGFESGDITGWSTSSP